jgi:hypothetical protein
MPAQAVPEPQAITTNAVIAHRRPRGFEYVFILNSPYGWLLCMQI